MRIARLHIKNFRSIESLDVALPDLCALVGPNNAGKSNIMLALSRTLGRGWARVQDFDDEVDRYRRELDRDVEISVTFDRPLIYRRFKAGPPAEIHTLAFTLTRYKIGDSKGAPRLMQECRDAVGKPVNVPTAAPRKGQQTKFEPLVGTIPRDVMDLVPLIYITTRRSLRDALPSNRYSLLRQLLLDINADFSSPQNLIEVVRPGEGAVTMPRAERWEGLMRAAMKLLRTDDFAALEKDINDSALRQLGFNPLTDADQLSFFFGPRDSFDFYKSLELHVDEAGLQINAAELGEGFQNALVMAVLEAFEKRKKRGAILMIEEPEMFLHPQMQRSLYATLRDISKHNQVIYATHSPQLLSVPRYDEVLQVRRELSGTAVARSALALDAHRRNQLERAFDPARNELFFARRVLIVEGDTEKLALPQWAAKLPVDLDRAGASIVEVGGKRNLLLFAEIAVSFGIPTGILYDRDSSDVSDTENATLNVELTAFDDATKSRRSWQLNAKYEDELRTFLGGTTYQVLCQRYPGMSNTIRQRQIAADVETAVPAFVAEALNWLVSGA